MSNSAVSNSFIRVDDFGASLLKRAFLLLGGAVATCLLTGYFLLFSGIFISSGMSLIAFFGVMALTFVVPRFGDTAAGYVGVLAVGALLGVCALPPVAYYTSVKGLSIVTNALLSTGVIFTTLSVYAIVSKRNFLSWAPFLSMAILAACVIGLLNAFLFHSSITSLVISYVVSIVSCGLILVRLSAALRGGIVTSVELALGLLLDVYNLFISLLQIFGNRN